MTTLVIGITIQDIATKIVKNMDTSLRIALEHILEEITVDGWAKLHVLVVTKLVMWEKIAWKGQRQLNLNLKKARQKLRMSGMRWITHGKGRKLKKHQMQKGSLHSMSQVVTLHQTKQEERHMG